MELTQKLLKDNFFYDPKTGLFTRLVNLGKYKAGTIAGWKSCRGYIHIKFKNKEYKAHRLAWFYKTGCWPNTIDHINHNKSDNSWVNLRNVTIQENQMNKPLPILNTSGVIGVCWHKKKNKWVAKIRYNGKHVHLGAFADLNDAAKARKSAEELYGYHKNHGLPLSTLRR